jgi:HK97 gp10 family phage protein
MASGLYIDTRQLTKGAAMFERLTKELPDRVSDVLTASAQDILTKAKQNVPKDRGAAGLAGSLSINIDKPLQKHITANAPYAAYVEFGTGRLAAQEVGKYPATYQAFAARFRSNAGRRSIKGMLFILMDWFERHGIKDKQRRYFIAKSIVINGTHAHPYMIPALIDQEKIIIRDMTTLLRALK